MFSRKLQALGYPNPPSSNDVAAYSSLTSPAFRTLVVWLEFTKIRFYPVEQRAALKAIESGDAWNQTFCTYLDDLDCTRKYSATGMTDEEVHIVLEWLLGQAVGAEYSDHAGEYNSLSRMWFVGGNGGGNVSSGSHGGASHSSIATQTLDCVSPAVRADFEDQVQDLAQLFQLPFDKTQLASILRVIRKRVEESIIASAAASGTSAPQPSHPQPAIAASTSSSSAAKPANKQQQGKSAPAAAKSSSARFARATAHLSAPPAISQTRYEVFQALTQLELGFESTGDQMVDRAAQVFRLLFLHDLRASQNLANELMMLAQEYTSDPKTDAKLGKVGI